MPGGNKAITGKDGKPFRKGDPRINRKGRPPKLPDLDCLLAEVLGEDLKGRNAMLMILIALRRRAFAGDVRASELLMDRAFGKLKVTKDIDVSFEQLTEDQIDAIALKLLGNGKNDKS